MPAFFCRNQEWAFPPSAVGSMSEGGVLIKPLLSCEQYEHHGSMLSLLYEGHSDSDTLVQTQQLQRGRRRSTDRVSEDVTVGRQDVLSPDKGQERRQDLLQLLHIQVPPFHSPLVNAVSCAAQQVGLWISNDRNHQWQLFNITHMTMTIYATMITLLKLLSLKPAG